MTDPSQAQTGAPGETRNAAWAASLAKASNAAIFFDGASNRKRQVTLRVADALDIVENGETIATWGFGDIRRADGPPGLLRLRALQASALARLEIADEATQGLVLSRCGALDAGHGSARQTRRIVFWSLAAACSIVLTALYGVPLAANQLAPLIPAGFERRLGETVDRQLHLMFRGRVCDDAEGSRALAVLLERLKLGTGLDVPFEVTVLTEPLPNAFALPGGRIYLMNGLLQKAQSADEIAGILAHEIGHVHHRDGLRTMIQTGGTSFLIGLLFGDITGATAVIFAGRSLLQASYSRDAERQADAFATGVMHALGRSPRPMGEFLVRITGAGGNGVTILRSHPVSEERLARMRAEDKPNSGPELLSAPQWRALKRICGAS